MVCLGKERDLGKVTLLNRGEFQNRDVSSQDGGTPHSWGNKSISYEASPLHGLIDLGET